MTSHPDEGNLFLHLPESKMLRCLIGHWPIGVARRDARSVRQRTRCGFRPTAVPAYGVCALVCHCQMVQSFLATSSPPPCYFSIVARSFQSISMFCPSIPLLFLCYSLLFLARRALASPGVSRSGLGATPACALTNSHKLTVPRTML